MNNQYSFNKSMNKKQKVRSGEFYSFNTKRVKGHKGQLRNLKKNGKGVGVIVTHSKYTRGRKNIELCENPQLDDKCKAYVVTTPEIINIDRKHVGKHHPNMQIRNSIDKSKIRIIAKRK